MKIIRFVFIFCCLFCVTINTQPDWESFCKKRGKYVEILCVSVKNAVQRKDTQHPVFHGCFDWHSSVHGHWALLRSYRLTGDKELLEIVKNSMQSAGMQQEYLYLKEHPSFEMPYGRAWFLRLMLEYEIVTGDRSYRYFSDYVAETLDKYLQGTKFRPDLDEYGNLSWAYRHLLQYYIHIKNKNKLVPLQNNLRKQLLHKYQFGLQVDYDRGSFFSPWGNLAHLLVLVLNEQEFKQWLADNQQEDLTPVKKLRSIHHLGINYSRAWGLWSIYAATGEQKYLRAYLAHITAGLSLHQKYKQSYFQYDHWVPQFGIYAITADMLITAKF